VALSVPLGLPKELGITGRVFSDFGTLFSNDQKNLLLTPTQLAANGGQQPVVFDSAAVRASAGFGVSWKSPVGPVRLDLALPIKKEAFDKTQLIHVSFGTRF
jgi:outer membrane protein insertion porin family